jgi:quercetin dioxygenase-like cupin family protein
MSRYRVSVEDVKPAPAAKSSIGFSNMDIRFLISDKTVGATQISLFRTIFPPGFSAHQKHIHVGIEEVVFGVQGRGCGGRAGPDGKGEEYEVSPGVAVFIPKDYVHWFRNLDPDKEVEICGVYSTPDAGEYKPEVYKFKGEITEKDKRLK